MLNYSAKEAWLSDPACYPLLFCLGSAGAFIVGMTVNCFANNKDVRINPAHKHQVIRDWGQEHTHTFTERLGYSINGRKFKQFAYEGEGVNHEEWMKAKKAKDQMK